MKVVILFLSWSYADEIADASESQRNYSTAYSEKKMNLDGLSCYTDVFPVSETDADVFFTE